MNDTKTGAISGSAINDAHLEKYSQKNLEISTLKWLFELLKHYKIIPEDTILVIKEIEQ